LLHNETHGKLDRLLGAKRATVARNYRIQIDRLELGPFSTNAYILTCRKTGDSVVIDAPSEAGKILEELEKTHPQYTLIKHNHFDHVGTLSQLRSALNVSVAAHPADAHDLPVPADILQNDGDKISFDVVQLEVLHTPGHTPGSLGFLTGHYLISGDTLFPGGPGKTWSPGFQPIALASRCGRSYLCRRWCKPHK
jgi:glyoxylase-like metal-dependent hydrolase (beta-lactamase superfamily II)